MNWMTWVFFVSLLSICLVSQETNNTCPKDKSCDKLRTCLSDKNPHLVVVDNFNGVISAQKQWNQTGNGCIIFLKKNSTEKQLKRQWPQIEKKDGAYLLLLSKWHFNDKCPIRLFVLQGNCNTTVSGLTDSECIFNHTVTGSCQVRCLDTKTICEQSTYEEKYCRDQQVQDKYFINITATNKSCLNCDNPVKKPEKELDSDYLNKRNMTLNHNVGEETDAAQAAGFMNKMANLAASINGSSATVTVGEGVTGILVRETDPVNIDEVSFAYVSPNDSMSIIESRDNLPQFSRSVTVSKEAFEKAVSLNVRVPFAALFRFTNLTKDEMNSAVLGNEVLAVEMGTSITNLTDKISLNFLNMKYEGIASCQSWNGEGRRPNWTGDGCRTINVGENITCLCSHLTFFAILLTPPNETVSSYDLNNLTIITQVGCGLSIFFLSIILFMHFLLRRTKASKATRILIHLVSAMFLLNFTFLINSYVAKLKSTVVCKIMAAFMHYFMLATFTWFAAQAFHLWLQLYNGGKIAIHHYILKVSITTWVLPSVVAIVLLIIGKYGEQVIYTNDTKKNVAMCWITDSNVHYIVNIGYYVLIFLFTFTTFIIILSWLICLKRTKAGNVKNIGRNGKSIVAILGLCCLLGITWGFAFFAYGVLRIPAYYIFTVLNSFQGFFLFIYYYNTSHSGEINRGENGHKNTSTSSTLKTNLDSFENPYINLPDTK
ncbi:adhesion G-protein coupled receptor G2-like [Siniperca chuatsi]|uniref:adhesion G-protein coupled receptor G2-like n=1 Tax=Siniperca chuatsi TaxID=119488 RepID=UPI001CE22141|nr:adhesion G-protein coupled receptor G2-like [Siniperca chuatsi]